MLQKEGMEALQDRLMPTIATTVAANASECASTLALE